MCIAIVAKPGVVVPTGNLVRSFARNSDGAGFAYVDKDNGKVRIKKGFMTSIAFLNAYQEVVKEGHHLNMPMLLHFRIATLGGINHDNCHPFPIKNGALIHNGVLWSGPSGAIKSDTREFAEGISEKCTPANLRAVRDDLEFELGGNKIAFLFDDGDTVILNEKYGTEVDGAWYSNSSYKNYGTSYKPQDDEYPYEDVLNAYGPACSIN